LPAIAFRFVGADGAGGFTVIVVDPDFVESCTEVAVIVACVAVVTVGAV
jgi:hypothetical protein